MPLVKISASVTLDQDKVNVIENELCELIETVLAKPRAYTMVLVNHAFVEFGNTDDPAASVELLSIGGLTPTTNSLLAKGISDILERGTGIPPGRVYIVFRNVEASNWGWNATLFG